MPKKSRRKISKSRIYLLSGTAVLLLVGVASCAFIAPQLTDKQTEMSANPTKKKGYNAYANIPSDEINYGGGILELMWNPNDPYYGYNTQPIAALVHIDSIDGGRNYSPISNQYTITQTYGKMTTLAVYKGDIKSGQQLNYARLGGIITAKEYWAQQKDKGIYLKGDEESTGKKYFKYSILDDIDIQVDKNYLVFLVSQSSKDGKYHEYGIAGLQYGLREARGSGAETTVLNNDTKKWESLSSIVKLD